MSETSQRHAPIILPRARPRWWVGAVYALLYALSVPWYLPAIDPVPIWLGLPFWVVLAVAGNLAVALFTSLVVVRTWPREPDGAETPSEGASP